MYRNICRDIGNKIQTLTTKFRLLTLISEPHCLQFAKPSAQVSSAPQESNQSDALNPSCSRILIITFGVLSSVKDFLSELQVDYRFHGAGLRRLARVVDVAAAGAPPCMRLHTAARQEPAGVDRDGVGCSPPRIAETMMPTPALPLLIAGLIATVILVMVALVVLVYSLLKKEHPGGLHLPDVDSHHPTGHVSSSANAVETTTTRGMSPAHVCSKKMKANEEKHSGKVMVVMAGDQSPSFIAQPLACTSHVKSRSSTFRIGSLFLGKMKKSAAKS